MSDKPAESENHNESRQQALQAELRELVDVVGPGPLVDLLMERAFQLQATDIHLDPLEDGLRLRLRVDGMLHDIIQLPKDAAASVISRLKLAANMDITERRVAQDGHINNQTLQNRRDIRVGSGPTIHGERLVLRLMPDHKRFTEFSELGLSEEQAADITRYCHAPYGMVLSVGPVGSGKSTTIYSCLDYLNQPEMSLATIEDPVERRIEGANQIQIDPKIGFGFAAALRGVLRQDPNVIMVGEIRDSETAHIAVRAGLTGIRVLSTLHSNDAVAAIDVFREFGIPSMFITDSLQGIISQRLIRRVCEKCRAPYQPDAGACEYLGINSDHLSDSKISKGTGCEHCFHTGYLGRTGIYETLGIQGDLREAILRGDSQAEILKMASGLGMTTMEESGKAKVLEGITTVQELHRVLV
ncbi:MAG: GspE/PulE family protein [Planctomycetes bacterium]|nr:GspE/PulE family protein [Planctomycetota bacterium]MCH9725606.1 GspE/PulE family protein [Planctomycetota bacterium]MCH9777660.1 GspE/PulE family protein [Planctomycetota bacterium]MDF1746165.1 GspE/PulE family protein [Gimesia sp.]